MIPKFRAYITERFGMVWVKRICFYPPFIDFEWENEIGITQVYSEDLDKVELMQSTGLEDKNGVEIYLDDVLSDEYGRKYIAVFKGDCVRCDAIRPGGKNRWISNHLEVIGNIHENPELLEVAE